MEIKDFSRESIEIKISNIPSIKEYLYIELKNGVKITIRINGRSPKDNFEVANNIEYMFKNHWNKI